MVSLSLVVLALVCSYTSAFEQISRPRISRDSISLLFASKSSNDVTFLPSSRRSLLIASGQLMTASTLLTVPTNAEELREDSMYAPKFVQTYEDFTSTSEGWSYKDVKIGSSDGRGGDLKDGDRVVFDWSGYTIG
jgi:hypothetical protein